MDSNLSTPITSLGEIRLRKESLRTDIHKDEQQVQTLWNKLFTPEQQSGLMTPTKRLQGIMGTSVNVVDGLILGWKLYRKFKGKKGFLR
ncbi:MAG: hypothetical protein IJ196_06815 [Prevotella sp.]|nr:hypothetical protein [Prevotella sp.]